MFRILAFHRRECSRLEPSHPILSEDSRDRAVVTVDYRRYHQITGLERNEIVRWYVGAKQAKKSHYSEIRAAGKVVGGEDCRK